MKRLFFIIAGLIVLLGVAVGVYFLFFSKDSPSLTVGTTNPFAGTGSGSVAPSSDLPTDGSLQNAGTAITPQFVKITDGPVAWGTAAIDVLIPGANTPSIPTSGTSTPSSATTSAPTTPDTEIRFIDRASGNVYSYLAHARTLTRISNKTLPGIQRASWVADGSRAYAQFLAAAGGEEHVNTYALNASGGDGYLLEEDLDEAQVAGTSTLFTLLSGTTGSVGTISGSDGSNSHTLFSSLLSSLIVKPTRGDFYATNKPSSQIDGYAFSINRVSGAFSRILGPFKGLTVLPSGSGSLVLYSYTDGGTYRLRVLDTKSHVSTVLPVATLTDKCVWAANELSIYCAVPTSMQGNLPDDWFQGATVFTDRIWKIDLTQRVATLVVDPSQVGKVSVDAVALSIDPSEDILTFTDAHSGALYAYDL